MPLSLTSVTYCPRSTYSKGKAPIFIVQKCKVLFLTATDSLPPQNFRWVSCADCCPRVISLGHGNQMWEKPEVKAVGLWQGHGSQQKWRQESCKKAGGEEGCLITNGMDDQDFMGQTPAKGSGWRNQTKNTHWLLGCNAPNKADGYKHAVLHWVSLILLP